MLSHLLELRRRLFRIFGYFLIFFCIFFFWATDLLHYFMWPLLKVLPTQSHLIATHLTSPVMTPLQLAVDIAMVCTIPLGLFELWYFVAPGLYRHERRPFCGLLICSLLLFALGLVFCFYIILPWMLHFFVQAVPAEVHFTPDIANATDFMTRMLCIFGLCFQIPLVCLLLVHLHLVTLTTLKQIRPYIIVFAFTIGMLLTPPDVLSQIMLALPLCLLYEFGIILTRFLAK